MINKLPNCFFVCSLVKLSDTKTITDVALIYLLVTQVYEKMSYFYIYEIQTHV